MVNELGGRARFVEENYGDSRLANRFGVTRYPAIFVDDVLMATPKDFGFYGRGEGGGDGRYAPFPSDAGEQRFRDDLSRMIALVLAGRKDEARAAAPPAAAPELASLPDLSIERLDGKRLASRDLRGRVVAVELWATWCPPCRGTLGWLGKVKQAHGDRLEVIALAVQSDEAEVRKLATELGLPFDWAMATPEAARALGDVTAVPTLLLFDREGRTAAIFYGAPPGMHAQAEAKLAALLQ